MTQVIKKKQMNMRSKLLACFALFCAFTILLLWVFQVALLDRFYQSIMVRKLDSAAKSIESAEDGISEEELNARVYSIAEDTGFCISVYSVKDNYGSIAASAHVKNGCVIHNTDSVFAELYENAKAKGKSYVRRYSLSVDGNDKAIILCRVSATADGERMILINAEAAPVEAAVSTLRIQLMWITLILLLCAAALALILSRRLARPVTKLNEEAKILATGSYNVNFDASGYREISELSDTLNYASSELSKVDKIQKELIANISHDLRTPLTLISGYSEAMRDIPGEMNPENMQIVIDETKRLTSLVNDVLDLSRLTSGKLRMKNEVFSITEALGETVHRYSGLTEREGYCITLAASEDILVLADKTRILQVIYNLVNNAVNYTGEDKTVTVSQRINGDYVRISVRDTGEGIPEDKLAVIWERYYKASEFHRRTNVGSGLGLSIVKGILDEYAFPYGVSSTVGEGSVFWFEMPIYIPREDSTNGESES